MDYKTLSFQRYNHIGIVQLVTTIENTLKYISGARALEKKLIVVKEVSEQAEVNEILVLNDSPHFVFFMDGDILTGAKQNRVLNTSVFLAPNSKTFIPVSCVEQGRWHYTESMFDKSPDIGTSSLRAKKAKKVSESIINENKFDADQDEVWDDVYESSLNLNEQSETSDLSELYEKKYNEFDDILKKFRIEENANGLSVFVKNKLLHIEIFNRTNIYKEYFTKILRSALVETYRLKPVENQMTVAEAFYNTVTLLDKVQEVEHSENPGVGIGIEKRFETDEFTGFELIFNDELIHLTALSLK